MLKTSAKKFFADDEGATSIEYALIAAIVSLAIIAALYRVKGSLQTVFTKVQTELTANAK